MKYTLLIMTMLQIKSIWREFKGLFRTTKQDIIEVNSMMIEIEDKFGDKDTVNGLMVIMGILMGLFLSLYYLFAGIKIGSIIFFIISTILIIKTWKDIGKMIKWLNSRDEKLIKRKITDRIWTVMHLSYIGYLIYYLIINW